MDKRKLDGAVDESSAEQQIHKSDIIIKYLEAYTQVSWHAGRHAGWLAYKIQTCFGSKHLIFAFLAKFDALTLLHGCVLELENL